MRSASGTFTTTTTDRTAQLEDSRLPLGSPLASPTSWPPAANPRRGHQEEAGEHDTGGDGSDTERGVDRIEDPHGAQVIGQMRGPQSEVPEGQREQKFTRRTA